MSLLALVSADRLKYLTKTEFVRIDDLVFRLHYRLTFLSLMIASVLLTSDQLFGKPIECINGSGNDKPLVPDKVVNEFCWVEGTFTLPKKLLQAMGNDVAPGIGKYLDNDEVISHAYYQWVSLVLFIQALTFYVTHLFWKKWEQGLIKRLINDLNKVILEPVNKANKCDTLACYLANNMGKHNVFAFRYFICEVINLIVVILHMVFINWFLGGQFSQYGMNVINYLDRDPTETVDPMAKTFPKLTKCTFRHFGPSGDVQRFDNLCLLPQNILNEKVYIILWFWLYVLAIVTAIMVIFRCLIMLWPRSRYYLLHNFHHLVPPGKFESVLKRCRYGDWFVLYLLGKNIDAMHYSDVIIDLSTKLDNSYIIDNKV